MCYQYFGISASKIGLTMDTYIVFHRKELLRPQISNPVTPDMIGWPHQYEMVAIVQADNLEAVWAKTNHVETTWQENEGVTALVEQARSTCVGDVVLSFEDSAWWVVATMGYQPLEVHEGAQHELCH
ncbi:MAG: hypothetical protein H8D34_16855 [Chloroflexi bacterium]|nr:hypothetical protein [Chloroflexota bacterium]